MSDTPIAVLQKAADLDLKLGFKPPDTLTMEAAKRWPRAFAQILPDYKPRLLALLRLPFCMVFSQILGETIFFCEDEHTKTALVEAGADVLAAVRVSNIIFKGMDQNLISLKTAFTSAHFTFRFRGHFSMQKNSKSIVFVMFFPGKGHSSHHRATGAPRRITEFVDAASHAQIGHVRQVLSHE